MTSNQLKHQVKLQEWTAAIQECRGSGLSVNQWCKNRGVTTTTYYRWERELVAMAGECRNVPQISDTAIATTTTFAELPTPRGQCRTVAQQAATVRIHDIAIDVYPGMNAELLKMLLETIRSC